MPTLLFLTVFFDTYSSFDIISSYPHSRHNTNSNTMCEQRLQINVELDECRRTFPDSSTWEGLFDLPFRGIAKGMCYCYQHSMKGGAGGGLSSFSVII